MLDSVKNINSTGELFENIFKRLCKICTDSEKLCQKTTAAKKETVNICTSKQALQ